MTIYDQTHAPPPDELDAGSSIPLAKSSVWVDIKKATAKKTYCTALVNDRIYRMENASW